MFFKNKETNLETQGSLRCEGEKVFFVIERGRRKSQQNSRICVLAQIKLVCPGWNLSDSSKSRDDWQINGIWRCRQSRFLFPGLSRKDRSDSASKVLLKVWVGVIAIKTQKVMWIRYLNVVFPAIAVSSLLEAYLTPGGKKISSGYRTRRSRSHWLKPLMANRLRRATKRGKFSRAAWVFETIGNKSQSKNLARYMASLQYLTNFAPTLDNEKSFQWTRYVGIL